MQNNEKKRIIKAMIQITRRHLRMAFQRLILNGLSRQPYLSGPKKEGTDDTFLAVGSRRTGNPLELGYREFDDGSYYVFHAMPCQNKWLKEADIGG
ncbi:MAG: hypothetical protein MdMp014T_0374 [Treponematales bacterium]